MVVVVVVVVVVLLLLLLLLIIIVWGHQALYFAAALAVLLFTLDVSHWPGWGGALLRGLFALVLGVNVVAGVLLQVKNMYGSPPRPPSRVCVNSLNIPCCSPCRCAAAVQDAPVRTAGAVPVREFLM